MGGGDLCVPVVSVLYVNELVWATLTDVQIFPSSYRFMVT